MSVTLFRLNWNLLVLVLRRGEKRSTQRITSRSKDENQQQTQPSYDTESGNLTQAALVGGECSHHCTIPAPHYCDSGRFNKIPRNFIKGPRVPGKLTICKHNFVRLPSTSQPIFFYKIIYPSQLSCLDALILCLPRAANNFPAGSSQIVRSNLFLLGHIPFLAGQTSITSYRYKSAPSAFT